MKPVTIIGGGLAGLSLGLALARKGVQVTLHEANFYPRHRVCGEFISGLSTETSDRLGISFALAKSLPLRSVAWWKQDKCFYQTEMPEPALGLSRFALDYSLAQEFLKSGGTLLERSRIYSEPQQGVVMACGRRIRIQSPWLGLKLHARKIKLSTDLEMHLGPIGYVGVDKVEDGRVNVCGLFRRQPHLHTSREELLLAYLRENKCHKLAEKIAAEEIDPSSCSAVRGFRMGFESLDSTLRIGDQFGMIPPFTGHGMTMAFQSAETALEDVWAYANENQSWETTVARVNHKLHQRFSRRLQFACVMHNAILHPPMHTVLKMLCNCRCMPFRWLLSWIRE